MIFTAEVNRPCCPDCGGEDFQWEWKEDVRRNPNDEPFDGIATMACKKCQQYWLVTHSPGFIFQRLERICP